MPTTPLPPPPAKKWLLRAVKLAILAILIWAVHNELAKAWEQLKDYDWQVQWPWILAAAAIYLLGMLPAGLFWHMTLRAMGQDSHILPTLRAYCIGHLGKYVPGKAIVVVMRAGMICGERVSASVAAVSVFVETLTMMGAGSFLAAAILLIWFRDRDVPAYLLGGMIAMMTVSALPTMPPIFRAIIAALGIGRGDEQTRAKVRGLGYGTILAGWLMMPWMWLFWGLSYWATLKALGVPMHDPLTDLPFITATVTLAVIAGFVVLIAPGGAGPRELVLLLLATPYLDGLVSNAQLMATVSVVMLRVVWLLADLLISGILYPMRPRREPVLRPSDEIEAAESPVHSP